VLVVFPVLVGALALADRELAMLLARPPARLRLGRLARSARPSRPIVFIPAPVGP
jgi:hypothetical protein